MGSKRTKKRPSTALAAAASVLLGIGLASSIYLTKLYVDATNTLKGGGSLDTFCNISESVNCETVAASDYSAFLGIPISVWGMEFFGLSLVVLLASHFRLLPLKRWDSMLLAFSAIGVPVTIILAWISVTRIHSLCIVCVLVYVVNAALMALLALPHWKQLGTFIKQGPKEFFEYVTEERLRVVMVLLVLVGLSQFLWMPKALGRGTPPSAPKPVAEVDSAEVGSWRGMPASRNTLGPVDAPIRIDEFTDFQCPFCGRAHEVMLEVVMRYPGKIHLVHRDFPLDHNCNPAIQSRFHPDACSAAYFAYCAAQQDLFWPYEALLFHNQRKLKPSAMLSMAKRVGIDTDKMKTCADAKSTHEAVLADITEGMKLGISGTPTFIVNGESIVGAKPMEFWEEKIESLLGIAPPKASSSTPAGASANPAPVPATSGN